MLDFSEERINSLLKIFVTLQPMKELPRQGYIYFGFKRNESDSIAAHSFQVIVISYLLARELKAANPELKIDICRVLTMAMLHDMGEAITGDIGYAVKLIASARISDVEEHAFDILTKELTKSDELKEIYKEYGQHKSLEAKIVRFANGLDAWIQVLSVSSTWMPANEEYNRKTSAKITGDEQLGDELSKIYNQMIEILRKREIGPKWPQGE